jgi:two-component system, NtrC family, response regulator HydG
MVRRSESRVLIAVGNLDVHEALASLLSAYAPDVTTAGGLALVDEVSRRPGLRILLMSDAGPDSTGLDLLHAVRQCRPDVAVLLLSDRPTVEHATEAIRRGAEDFVPVPYADGVVLKEVARILEAADLRDRVDHLHRIASRRYGFDRIISASKRMRPVFELAMAASRSDTPVLIVGETGTGKELVARSLHINSRRAQQPFTALNCAALPRDLVESELFGHRRGAFSGALADHPGLFVGAHGGTLFLDEVGELALDVQAKLLRVLQDGEVRPVGSLASRQVNVRIIAATNRTLAAMRDGGMRQDLFFRLSVLVIEIPPLRERREDLPLLIAHILGTIRERGLHRVEGIEPAALALLAAYSFPGNIRELENVLEATSLALPVSQHAIRTDDVRAWLRGRGVHDAHAHDASPPAGVPINLAQLEAWAIAEAMRQSHGNKSVAAHLLGISRDTLYRKLHDLDMPDSRT